MAELLQKLAQGNAGFSTHRFTSGLHIVPSLKVFIIGCVDPRVDPAQILGLELGEAAMIRNIGGRITTSVLDELCAAAEADAGSRQRLRPGLESRGPAAH